MLPSLAPWTITASKYIPSNFSIVSTLYRLDCIWLKRTFHPPLNMKGVRCIQLPLSGICIIWGQFKTDLTVNVNLLSSAPDIVIT